MYLSAHLQSCIRLALRISTLLTVLLTPTPAEAFFSEIGSYLKDYQFGVDYTSSYDGVDASYEMAKPSAAATDTCADEANHPGKQICTVTMKGGGSSGFGIVIAQPFKRQGLFYFRPDVSFGARYLTGALPDSGVAKDAALGLPLNQLKFNLGAVVIKPYIQFGITPESTWPDLLISLGPSAQMAFGNVTVNHQRKNVAVVTSSSSYITGFVAIELVLWRFGKGSLAVFTENDISGGGRGSKFYPNGIDGMSDFHANFSRSVSGGFYGFGAKILSAWP